MHQAAVPLHPQGCFRQPAVCSRSGPPARRGTHCTHLMLSARSTKEVPLSSGAITSVLTPALFRAYASSAFGVWGKEGRWRGLAWPASGACMHHRTAAGTCS